MKTELHWHHTGSVEYDYILKAYGALITPDLTGRGHVYLGPERETALEAQNDLKKMAKVWETELRANVVIIEEVQ
jgi:hypothetical protein